MLTSYIVLNGSTVLKFWTFLKNVHQAFRYIHKSHCIIHVFKGCLFVPVYNIGLVICRTHLQFRPKVHSKSQLTHCVLRKKLILVTMLFIMLQKSWEKHLISDEFEASFAREGGQNGVFSLNFTSQYQKSHFWSQIHKFSIFTKIKIKVASRFI